MSRKRRPTNHPPVLNLEQVDVIAHNQNPAYEYFHLFGIFIEEVRLPCGICYTLLDETKKLLVRLDGDLASYSKPLVGDIVRVHRAKINAIQHMAEIITPTNVVVWEGFGNNLQYKTAARQPTINEDDRSRCRELQKHFVSKVTRIGELALQNSPQPEYLLMAGQLQDRKMDPFGHLELMFTDGTGELTMRVFAKQQMHEDDTHFRVARDLKQGDYFFVNNIKYYTKTKKLFLSANRQFGKSIRPVAKLSVMGRMLTDLLEIRARQAGVQSNHQEIIIENQDEPRGSQSTEANEDQLSGRRRSPRLYNRQVQHETPLSQQAEPTSNTQTSNNSSEPLSSPISWSDTLDSLSQAVPSLRSQSSQNQLHPTMRPTQSPTRDTSPRPYRWQPIRDESLPKYTKLSDIKIGANGYNFVDIVGQIRAEPRTLPNFGNCILQLYDGSEHNHSSFYSFEVERVMPECVLMIVYSKQKPEDTEEHIMKAKQLQEGDIILVKNVKASFKENSLKLELSANKKHDKSINVIDKNSAFGRKILDIVENPIVEGLNDPIEQSSDSMDTQCTDNFINDIACEE